MVKKRLKTIILLFIVAFLSFSLFFAINNKQKVNAEKQQPFVAINMRDQARHPGDTEGSYTITASTVRQIQGYPKAGEGDPCGWGLGNTEANTTWHSQEEWGIRWYIGQHRYMFSAETILFDTPIDISKVDKIIFEGEIYLGSGSVIGSEGGDFCGIYFTKVGATSADVIPQSTTMSTITENNSLYIGPGAPLRCTYQATYSGKDLENIAIDGFIPGFQVAAADVSGKTVEFYTLYNIQIVTSDTCTVAFDTNGGSPASISAQTVSYYKRLSPVADPTFDGKVFAGWYNEKGELVDLTKPITESAKLTAKWGTPKYFAAFEAFTPSSFTYTDSTVNQIQGYPNAEASDPAWGITNVVRPSYRSKYEWAITVDLTPNAYTFCDKTVMFTKACDVDVLTKIKFECFIESDIGTTRSVDQFVAVYFVRPGETNATNDNSLKLGGGYVTDLGHKIEIELSQSELRKIAVDGKFAGFQVACFDPYGAFIGNWARLDIVSFQLETPYEFSAKWENYDGTVLQSDDPKYYNETDTFTYKGETPERENTAQYTYEFVGWAPETGKLLTKDTTFVAQYSETLNQYTVTFNSNGGNEVPEIKEYYGEPIDEPAAPTKEGAIFDYWYTTDEEVPYDFDTPITGDLVLNAKWIDKYSHLAGRDIVLNKDIVMNYYFDYLGYTNVYAKFDFDGEEYIDYGVSYQSKVDGATGVKFSLDKIVPQGVVLDMTITVYGTDEICERELETYTGSVRDYLEILLTLSAEELGYSETKLAKMKTLVVDLLYYAESAQNLTKFMLDDLATANLTPEQKALKSEIPDDAPASITAVKGVDNPNYRFSSAGLTYGNKISLFFRVAVISDSDVYIKVTNGDKVAEIKDVTVISEEGGKTVYEFKYDGVSLTDFDKELNVEIYTSGDERVGKTLVYSVNSYVNAMWNDTEHADFTDLLKCAYVYSTSAVAFVNA